jgi:hypothetical protein
MSSVALQSSSLHRCVQICVTEGTSIADLKCCVRLCKHEWENKYYTCVACWKHSIFVTGKMLTMQEKTKLI